MQGIGRQYGVRPFDPAITPAPPLAPSHGHLSKAHLMRTCLDFVAPRSTKDEKRDTIPMQLSRLLTKNDILADTEATNASEFLAELGRVLADRIPGLDADEITRMLEDRERIQSTAVDSGIAIPHAKTDAVTQPACLLVRSRRGIEFGAPDGKPVHLFFAIIAPASDMTSHLKLLARVSRLFGSWKYREALLQAQDSDEMFQAILESDRHEGLA